MQKTQKISIEAIKSKIITPKDNLLEAIITALKNSSSQASLQESSILIITSKVIAITQGLVVKITSTKAFERLVKKEADRIFENHQGASTLKKTLEKNLPRRPHAIAGPLAGPAGKQIFDDPKAILTLKNNIFIPWAGIDRSNMPKGQVVLWPKNPYQVAHQLCQKLKKHFKLQKLGIVITDSHCIPLRKGVSGIAIGYAGFKGVNDLRGHKDLYDNPLQITQQATADNLATAAHLVMGESNEATPFAIIQNAPVQFTSQKINPAEATIPPLQCLFAPLYQDHS